MSVVVVMQLLVEERVLERPQQNDPRVQEYFVAIAAVDHRKGHLAVSTKTTNELTIFAGFLFHSNANQN